MTDRMLTELADWLADGPERGPVDGFERAMAASRRTSQRPSWMFPGRVLPQPAAWIHDRRITVIAAAVLLLLLATLAFVAGTRPRVPPPFGPAGNGLVGYDVDGTILLSSLDGKTLIRLPTGDGYARTPTFSPDGTKVAFWSRGIYRNGHFSLWVATLDGTSAWKVSGSMRVQITPAINPSWSPDGRWLLFQSFVDADERDAIFITAADGSAEPDRIGRHDRQYWQPRFSPDGRWIAALQSDETHDAMVLLRRDGTVVRELVTAPVTSPDVDCPFDESGVAWAPDSTRLAFVHYIRPSCVVTVASVDGSAHDVVQSSARLDLPQWSPRGDRIAFVDGAVSLRVITPEGDSVRTDLAVARACGIGWSPDGRWVYAADDAGCGRFSLIDPSSSDPPVPITLPQSFREPDWQRVAP